MLLILAFVLPAAAFSAITKGLGELLTVTLLLVVGFLTLVFTSQLFMIHPGFYWMELEWVKNSCLTGQLATAAVIVLLWQYHTGTHSLRGSRCRHSGAAAGQ